MRRGDTTKGQGNASLFEAKSGPVLGAIRSQCVCAPLHAKFTLILSPSTFVAWRIFLPVSPFNLNHIT